METIFDLPAHPLLVHFPVVAIPTLATLALVMVLMPRFREKYALPIIALGIVTTVATFVAAKSGEELTESLGLKDEFIEPHQQLGEMLRIFVLGLAVTIVGLVAVGKRSAATGRDVLSVGVSLFVVAFSLLSIVWTVRTGHEGAKAVWGTGEFSSDDAEQDEDDDEDQDDSDDEVIEATSDTVAETVAVPAETDPPAETTTTASTTITTSTTTSTTASSETEDSTATGIDGKTVYESNCARCHAADGSGGRGPSLQGLAIEQPDQTDAIAQVTNGGDGMPSFGARLDAAQIQAAVDYVYATF